MVLRSINIVRPPGGFFNGVIYIPGIEIPGYERSPFGRATFSFTNRLAQPDVRTLIERI